MVVTATPVTIAVATRPAAKPTPSPVVPNRSVLLVQLNSTDHYVNYTHFSALEFTEGISVDKVIDDGWTSANFKRHRGVIVVGERPTFNLLKKVREFVFSGGNAALFFFQCETGLQKDLQLSFEISCADARLLVNERRRGEQMAPFLHGLVMDITEISIDFVPGPSRRFECVAKLQWEDRTGCTALSGNVGNGKAIFIDRGTSYSYASAPTWFEDEHFHDADHREAASKLLNWLVEEAGAADCEPIPSTQPPP